VCSKYLQTFRYVDRQRALVIYDAIAYRRLCYENRNMTPAKNFHGNDFCSNVNFVQGVIVYQENFFQTTKMISDPLLGHPNALPKFRNLLNFWDYTQGALRGPASSGSKFS